MQKFSHQSLGNHYQTAMEKVRSVLKFSDRNLIQNIENQIDVYTHRPEKQDTVKNIIPTILESIAEKNQLKITYLDIKNETSERIIEAVGVFYEINYWYVMAFCTMRKDFRQFRVDRILKIEKTQNLFLQNYGNIADYRKKSDIKKVEVKLLVEKKIMPHLVNSKIYYGLTAEEETGNGMLLTFETEWIDEGFPRWLITFLDYAQIIEPENLKLIMNNLISNISKNLK
jgi:predicted DNA-binding transcriptional regulator YafY